MSVAAGVVPLSLPAVDILRTTFTRHLSLISSSALSDAKRIAAAQHECVQLNAASADDKRRIAELEQQIADAQTATAVSKRRRTSQNVDRDGVDQTTTDPRMSSLRDHVSAIKSALSDSVTFDGVTDAELVVMKRLLSDVVTQIGDEQDSRRECKICLERPWNTYLSCRHCFCRECADKMQTCPMCNQTVTHRHNFYG